MDRGQLTRPLATALVSLALALTASAQTKRTPRTPKPKPYSASLQAVVVTTPDWDDVHGTAQLFERRSSRSRWRKVGDPFGIIVGRTGLAWGTGLHDHLISKAIKANATEQIRSSEFPIPHSSEPSSPLKKEGDGKSPAGIFTLSGAFGRIDEPAGTKFPYLKVTEFTECVDDAVSSHYNTTVNRLQVGIFDWKSSEKMVEVDPEYDLGVFVDHNPARVRGGGSCIFLHIWKDAGTPTAGCTAMSREDAERLLKFLDPRRNPVLIQLPKDEYDGLRRHWRLP